MAARTLRLTAYRVFESICAKDATGADITVSAEELGGQYLNAISVFNVPADAEYGRIAFVFRPYAVSGETEVYGDAAVAVYENGNLIFTAALA